MECKKKMSRIQRNMLLLVADNLPVTRYQARNPNKPGIALQSIPAQRPAEQPVFMPLSAT